MSEPIGKVVKTYTLVYTEEIRETEKEGSVTRNRVLGERTMSGMIEVVIDLDLIVKEMGTRACQSKSGRCRDGFVLVKRIGKPAEQSVEMIDGWRD
jgi:hypothetical protein